MVSSCAANRARVGAGIVAFLAAVALSAEPGALSDDWKFDVVHLKNGIKLQGLLLEETPTYLRFSHVRRKPGSPTRIFDERRSRNEVARVERLGPKDRETLVTRLKALDPTGDDETSRMEILEIKAAPWGKRETGGL